MDIVAHDELLAWKLEKRILSLRCRGPGGTAVEICASWMMGSKTFVWVKVSGAD